MISVRLVIKVAITAILLCGNVVAKAQFSKTDFRRLSSILGVWRASAGTAQLMEHWVQEDDTVLIGRSFLIRGADTIPEESVRLTWSDSVIAFSAAVIGQNEGRPVTFLLKQIGSAGFVFENSQHDFPQRIRYLPKGDSLFAQVSGVTSKGARELKYKYLRVAKVHDSTELHFFVGRWWLKLWAKGAAEGKPDVNASWLLEKSNTGSSMTGRVSLMGGRRFTNELIAFDPGRREWTRTIAAADSSYYTFTTKGWAGNSLIWIGTRSTFNGIVPMKQEILRTSAHTFRAEYYLRSDGEWRLIATEELERSLD